MRPSANAARALARTPTEDDITRKVRASWMESVAAQDLLESLPPDAPAERADADGDEGFIVVDESELSIVEEYDARPTLTDDDEDRTERSVTPFRFE